MIEMIKELSNMDLNTSINESILFTNEGQDPTSLTSKEVYEKGREVAVNLNDEIQRLVISDTDTFVGTIHKVTYDILNMTKIDVNSKISDQEKSMTMNVQMTANDLKARLYRIPDLILTTVSYLDQCDKDNNINSEMITNVHDHIIVMSKAALELIALIKLNDKSLTESSHEEDVEDYIKELKKLIEDIRKYYDDSDYAKILTPRKKKYEKMVEYVKGALDRKYTLRIPLYKVENVDKDTRDVIENKFIKDVQEIVAKYDNYALLTPNWDEDEDIFIYLTLKEPFGKEDDHKKRSSDSKDDVEEKKEDKNFDTNSNNKEKDGESLNEASEKMSKEERNALPDEEFGLPTLRKYPLHDEKHIRDAVRMFHFCRGNNKEELAKNIASKVKEKNLVGIITVSTKNPFKKYFPDWMIEGSDEKPEKEEKKTTQNETVVFVNGKLI